MERGGALTRTGRGERSRLVLTRSLGDGWVVEYVLRKQQGRWVVDELRIIFRGQQTSLPLGGLPARVVKQVTLGAAYDLLRDEAKAVLEGKVHEGTSGRTLTPEEARHHFESLMGGPPETYADMAPHRPGRTGRPDIFYARIADSYVRLVRAGSRSPVKDLAAALRKRGDWYSDGSVSQLVFTARERGLLSESPVGRAGGDLTPEARKLLESEGSTRK